jgi:hypothetical protein
MWCNGNSFAAGGGPGRMPADDPKVRSLPWLFRVLVPGFAAGWPPE